MVSTDSMTFVSNPGFENPDVTYVRFMQRTYVVPPILLLHVLNCNGLNMLRSIPEFR